MFGRNRALADARKEIADAGAAAQLQAHRLEQALHLAESRLADLNTWHLSYLAAREEVDDLTARVKDLDAQIVRMNHNYDRALRLGWQAPKDQESK